MLVTLTVFHLLMSASNVGRLLNALPAVVQLHGHPPPWLVTRGPGGSRLWEAGRRPGARAGGSLRAPRATGATRRRPRRAQRELAESGGLLLLGGPPARRRLN